MKIVLPLVALLLSACVGTVDAPSLLARAAEREDVDAPKPPATPLTPATAAQAALIARLVAQANQGDAAFEKALPAATTSAAPLSEAWIAAQNARSAVDVARAPTLDSLSAFDAAIGDAIDNGQETAALVAARQQVQAIYDRQSARLENIIR